MLKANTLISVFGLGLIQLLLLLIMPASIVKAQSRCSLQELEKLEGRLRNDSPPSRESREIKSSRHLFRMQIPANYRAVAERDSILILSPEAHEYYLCNPPTSTFYMDAWVGVEDSEVPSSASLRQAFDELRAKQGIDLQGSVQEATISGQSALRFHYEYGGDGLTRNYVLFSPQRTKLIIISSWVGSVNDSEPEILRRIVNNFEVLFSVTENSPKIGIVPTLDACGLAVRQKPDDKLTHILTAYGGESYANLRIDNQMLQLSSIGGQIAPEQTRTPSRFTFQNSDRSITATLEGNWRIENLGSRFGWVTNNATLRVTKKNQTTKLPVFASLGCHFSFY